MTSTKRGNVLEMMVGLCFVAVTRGAALSSGYIDWRGYYGQPGKVARAPFEKAWWILQWLNPRPTLYRDGPRRGNASHANTTLSEYWSLCRSMRIGTLSKRDRTCFYNTMLGYGYRHDGATGMMEYTFQCTLRRRCYRRRTRKRPSAKKRKMKDRMGTLDHTVTAWRSTLCTTTQSCGCCKTQLSSFRQAVAAPTSLSS